MPALGAGPTCAPDDSLGALTIESVRAGFGLAVPGLPRVSNHAVSAYSRGSAAGGGVVRVVKASPPALPEIPAFQTWPGERGRLSEWRWGDIRRA